MFAISSSRQGQVHQSGGRLPFSNGQISSGEDEAAAAPLPRSVALPDCVPFEEAFALDRSPFSLTEFLVLARVNAVTKHFT